MLPGPLTTIEATQTSLSQTGYIQLVGSTQPKELARKPPPPSCPWDSHLQPPLRVSPPL